MASIVGKKINGKTYYYLVESARVDGRPRIVAQRYLGSAAEIEAAVAGGLGEPARTEHRAFGAVAAAWATVTRLGVAELVDGLVGAPGARTTQAETTLGDRLALAVVQRIVGPMLGPDVWWWTGSAADRFLRPRPDPAALEPAAFWPATQLLTTARLDHLLHELLSRAAGTFDLTRDALALDLPAFDTLTVQPVDPTAEHSARPLLVGVGLIASREGAIPLAAQAYLRGEADGDRSANPADSLAERHWAAERGELTLILEPSRHERIPELAKAGRHIVAALPLADFPELAGQSAAYRPLDPARFPGVTAWETRTLVSTVDMRVIALRSATLHAAQSLAFADALTTATRQLAELARAAAAGTIHRSRDRLLAEVVGITRARRVDRVLTATVTGADPEGLRVHWRVDEAARSRLHNEVFGRQLIATNRENWAVDEVLTAYRARHYLESTFRQLGEPERSPSWPGFEWTEQRIAIHSLLNVLATAVSHLMRHEAHRAGLDFSVRELLDCLAGIQETVLRYPSTGGRPRTRHLLTERTPTQQRLFEVFDLARYAPRR